VFRDEDVRTACFLSLDVLCAQFGDEIPYRGGLERGFAFRGARIPFLNYQKGIYRAAAQRGPAALSLHTSYSSPYDDAAVDDGFRYAYRAGPIDQPDNRALRAVAELRVPIVYFVGTRPGCYRAEYPWYVSLDEPKGRFVLVTPGRMTGPADEREAVSLDDPVERRYAVREVRVRLHQARFRGAVLPAYRERCTICSLRELRLLDAAHIVADFDVSGIAAVSNGLPRIDDRGAKSAGVATRPGATRRSLREVPDGLAGRAGRTPKRLRQDEHDGRRHDPPSGDTVLRERGAEAEGHDEARGDAPVVADDEVPPEAGEAANVPHARAGVGSRRRR
jgi:putative restriction endonuclease